MSNIVLFNCETCFKTEKTKIGLIRHHSANVVTEINNIEPTQHSTSTPIPIDVVKTAVNTVSQNNLTELLKQIQDNLSVDECFTPKLRDAMKKYNFHDTEISYCLQLKRYRKSI